MGTTPNPNVMQAPALANAFANRMQQSARDDNNAALILERDRRGPELAGRQRRAINQADEDYQRDPMSLAQQKTQGILAREEMKQSGANDRAMLRRYGVSGSRTRVASDLMQYAIQKGLQPYQAAALVAHMEKESGFNTRAVGDNGTAFYGFQFRNDRKSGIENFARETGRDIFDPKTSIDYLLQEMQTSEANRGGRAFFNAKSPEEASMALTGVIRHSTKGKHANEARDRIALTQQYSGMLDGGNTNRTKQPTNEFGVSDGVDENGRTFRSMYLPSYQAQALIGDPRYKVEVDPMGKQNNRGMLPYKVYINEQKPATQTGGGTSATTNAKPVTEIAQSTQETEDDEE